MKIYSNLKLVPFSTAQNNEKIKQVLRQIVNCISYLVSCQLKFHFSCRLYLLLAPPEDVLSKIAGLCHYFKCQEKYEFKSNFFKTPI